MRDETRHLIEFMNKNREDGYAGAVEEFQRMFDKQDDEFRWVYIRMNRDLGFTVMLDNDETNVCFDEETVGIDLAYWTGKFKNHIGNAPGVNALLDAFKIPYERY